MRKSKLSRQKFSPTEGPLVDYVLSRYITTEQAAHLLGIIPTSVNHLIHKGKIKGLKLGRDWLVLKSSLVDYLQTKSTKGRPTSRSPKLKKTL
jgi:excisionase family DNA binding protein